MSNSLLDTLSYTIEHAMKAGADAADAVMFDSEDISVRQRLGVLETIEQENAQDMGLRVMIKGKKGYKQAIVSSNNTSSEAREALVERAVAMARIAPEDPYAGFANTFLLAKGGSTLDLCDNTETTVENLKTMAAEVEQAAIEVTGVTNSDSAETSHSRSKVGLVTSEGFAGSYETTSTSVSVSVIAGKGTAMETDWDYAVARHREDLKDIHKIGQNAGQRAVKRLNPKKVKTCQVSIIYEWRVAKGLLGSLAGAINGASIARGTSFLKNKMNEQIFAEEITIVDDPFIKRGLASEPFDGEGVAGKKLHVIDKGVLTTWLMDVRSANQLGLTTTGHAGRGTSSPPSPSSSNLYMEAGKLTPEELMADIKEGFFVTDAFGMGVNGVTGDYSQGASGFWIENGQIAYPVSEVTIAGNLIDMFRHLTPANDLVLRYGTNSPTVRIDGMMVAGE